MKSLRVANADAHIRRRRERQKNIHGDRRYEWGTYGEPARPLFVHALGKSPAEVLAVEELFEQFAAQIAIPADDAGAPLHPTLLRWLRTKTRLTNHCCELARRFSRPNDSAALVLECAKFEVRALKMVTPELYAEYVQRVKDINET